VARFWPCDPLIRGYDPLIRGSHVKGSQIRPLVKGSLHKGVATPLQGGRNPKNDLNNLKNRWKSPTPSGKISRTGLGSWI